MDKMTRRLVAAIAWACAFSAFAAEPPPGPGAAPPAAAAKADPAGTVDFLEGSVAVVRPQAPRRVLAKGDVLTEGDTLVTGADGEAHVQMADGGYIAARPGTRVRIVKYQANGDERDRSILNVVEGSLRVITGWIGKFNPKGYELRTKVATIGVRGTDHETLVRTKGDADGEAGVYDRVYAGSTVIRSKSGTATVTAGRAGFQHATRAQAPRVLDKVPGFFRPTRNEGLLEGRHEKVQAQLDGLREERRTALRTAAAKSRADRMQARKAAKAVKKAGKKAERQEEKKEDKEEKGEKAGRGKRK